MREYVVPKKENANRPSAEVAGEDKSYGVSELGQLQRRIDDSNRNQSVKQLQLKVNRRINTQNKPEQGILQGQMKAIQSNSNIMQLAFVPFTISQNKTETEIINLTDLLVWLRSNPIPSKDSPRSYADKETLTSLAHNIIVEKGDKVHGSSVWMILKRIANMDKSGHKNMPYYRMMEPEKVENHFAMLRQECDVISKEKEDKNNLTRRLYFEEAEKLDDYEEIFLKFSALMHFGRNRHQVKYRNADATILDKDIAYIKRFKINIDVIDLELKEEDLKLFEALEKEYNEAKIEMQNFLRIRTSLTVERGDGVKPKDWTTHKEGDLDSNEIEVPKHFKRKLTPRLMKKQMKSLKAKLNGYELVGFHGTSVESISTLVKEGIDPKRFGTGHGSGKGEGLYIIPLMSSLGKTLKFSSFWGHSFVAVFLPSGIKQVNTREVDNVQKLEESKQKNASGEKLVYSFGAGEMVIPPSLCSIVRLVCDPSSVSMVNPSDLSGNEASNYEEYDSPEEEHAYLKHFKSSKLGYFDRSELVEDDSGIVFQ